MKRNVLGVPNSCATTKLKTRLRVKVEIAKFEGACTYFAPEMAINSYVCTTHDTQDISVLP